MPTTDIREYLDRGEVIRLQDGRNGGIRECGHRPIEDRVLFWSCGHIGPCVHAMHMCIGRKPRAYAVIQVSPRVPFVWREHVQHEIAHSFGLVCPQVVGQVSAHKDATLDLSKDTNGREGA